jgi:hypothetical protein
MRAANRYYDYRTNDPHSNWLELYYSDLKNFGLSEVINSSPTPANKFIKQRHVPVVKGSELGQAVLLKPIKNPYVGFGGLPVKEQAFIGRHDILAYLETIWSNAGALPLFLYGHRRMGKTSILKNLNLRNDSNTVLVVLDMQNAASVDSTADFYLELALGVYQEVHKQSNNWLGLEDMPDETRFMEMAQARRELNRLFESLEEKRQAQRIILAIDEFELIEQRIAQGRILPETLPYLRSLVQRYNWLALIFSGLLSLDEMGQDYQAAFYGNSENVRVSYFSEVEAEELICRPDPEFLLEYEPALVSELYNLTNGQPYLLQRLCWELVNAWNQKFLANGPATERLLKLADLPTLLNEDFYRSASYYFEGVWSQSGLQEQTVMLAVAAGGAQGITLAELQLKLPEIPHLDETLKILERRDVLKSNQTTMHIRYAAELNRRWIERNKT